MTAGQRFFTILGISFGIPLLFGFNHLIQNIQYEEAIEDSAAKEPVIYFLPSQGLIHTVPGEEVPVMLFGATYQGGPIFGDQNQMTIARIDNSNLIVEESSIEPGIVHKNMTPFSICLEVVADEPGVQIITQVILLDENGKELYFDIGQIVIDTSDPNEGDAINVRNHAGGSDLFSPYSFTIINQSPKECVITAIDFASLSPFLNGVELLVDGEEVEYGKDILLGTGQQLGLSAKFKAYTGKKVFLVSPSILYHLQGENTQYIYDLPSGIVGIPDAEAYKNIYEKYFQN